MRAAADISSSPKRLMAAADHKLTICSATKGANYGLSFLPEKTNKVTCAISYQAGAFVTWMAISRNRLSKAGLIGGQESVVVKM